MFILAKGGQTYARLRFNVGPKGEIEIPVVVDYSHPFEGSDHDAWEQEYLANIHPEPDVLRRLGSTDTPDTKDEPWGLGLDLPDEREIEPWINNEVDGFDQIIYDEMR